MGFRQTKKLLHSKGNSQHSMRQPTEMGEKSLLAAHLKED
jgi:hypothetical protein